MSIYIYISTAFILGVDRKIYVKLIKDIQNSNIVGQVKYQDTNNDAYKMLLNRKKNPNNTFKLL